MPRKQQKRRHRGNRRNNQSNSVLPKMRIQPYQHVTTLWIAGNDQIITTSAVGLVSLAVPINTSTIVPFFSTTWQTTFDEYCVLECQFLVIPMTKSDGLLRMYIDENSAGTPTNITAQGRLGITISNNSACAPRTKFQGQLQAGHIFRWTATDVGDLSWNNTLAIPTSISYLKIYTDTALGSPSATLIHLVRTNVRIRFRMPLQ